MSPKMTKSPQLVPNLVSFKPLFQFRVDRAKAISQRSKFRDVSSPIRLALNDVLMPERFEIDLKEQNDDKTVTFQD